MGTPEFAVPTLTKLHEELGVGLVVTTPDKPKGRGLKLISSPVKQKAAELGISALQPESLKEQSFIDAIAEFKPDIIVVLAFRILPKAVYEQAKLGCFNIHASLLPKFRGAAPINWAIIRGEKESGLTSFLLKEKVDTGDIMIMDRFDIPEGYTAGDLHDLMMPKAAEMAVRTCQMLFDGNYTLIQQDNSIATSAPKIFPEQCRINWNMDSTDLCNFINGVSPVPGAWTELNGRRFKFMRVRISEESHSIPGKFIIDDKSLFVSCNNGSIQVLELQPEGKKAMRTDDFLNGWKGENEGKFE
jgi:methionyl-tRNA formyltransferase